MNYKIKNMPRILSCLTMLIIGSNILSGQTFQATASSSATEGESDIDYGENNRAFAESSISNGNCKSSSSTARAEFNSLYASSSSNQCILTNRAAASCSYSVNPIIHRDVFTAAGPMPIPLVFTVSFNGSIDVESDWDNRWSAAAGKYEVKISSTTSGNQRFSHYVGAQRGVIEIYDLNNMTETDGYVVFKPQVRINAETFDITEKIDKILEKFENLTQSEKDSNNLNYTGDARSLFQNIQGLQTWELNHQKLFLDSTTNKEISKILDFGNLIKDLGFVEGTPFSLTGSADYHYEGNRDYDVVVQPFQSFIFGARVSVSASSSKNDNTRAEATCGSVSGSGVSISAIHLKDDFDYTQINLDNLKVIVEETGDTLDVELPENLKNASIQYEKSVNIYPNPARNQLFVEHDKQGALEESFIEIYNLQGQLLIEAKLLGAFGTIDISKLENGVYGVKVWDKHKREFIPKKILKI